MSRIKFVSLTILFLILFPVLTTGQRHASPPDAITKLISEKEPLWKLKSSEPFPFGDFKIDIYEWEHGEMHASAIITTSNSENRSMEWFEMFKGEYVIPHFRYRLLDRPVKNLGEANYRWEDYYNPSMTGVTFKQGKVVVRVGSSSKAAAERLAFYIYEELKQAHKNSK